MVRTRATFVEFLEQGNYHKEIVITLISVLLYGLMVRTRATFVGFLEQGSYQKEIVITLNFE
jgi:hypothetical protein